MRLYKHCSFLCLWDRMSRQFKVDNLKSNFVKCHNYIHIIFNLKSNLVKCCSYTQVIFNFFEESTLNCHRTVRQPCHNRPL